MPSRLRDEAAGERVRVFEFAIGELCSTFLEGCVELGPFLGGQIVIVREQYFDGDTLGQLDRLVEDDLPVVDMSS
jgi:hypothetical protein